MNAHKLKENRAFFKRICDIENKDVKKELEVETAVRKINMFIEKE